MDDADARGWALPSCWARRHLQTRHATTRIITRATAAKMTANEIRTSRFLFGWPPPFLPPPPVDSSGSVPSPTHISSWKNSSLKSYRDQLRATLATIEAEVAAKNTRLAHFDAGDRTGSEEYQRLKTPRAPRIEKPSRSVGDGERK